jgi:hypothetical protein
MAVFNVLQIKEINDAIEKISKVISPSSEIGAHGKNSVSALLKTQSPAKTVVYFSCKPEYSDAIVSHFIKEKGLTKNRFHKNNQSTIFILK